MRRESFYPEPLLSTQLSDLTQCLRDISFIFEIDHPFFLSFCFRTYTQDVKTRHRYKSLKQSEKDQQVEKVATKECGENPHIYLGSVSNDPAAWGIFFVLVQGEKKNSHFVALKYLRQFIEPSDYFRQGRIILLRG